MAITQNNRLVQVNCPLGGDVLLLRSMEGNEELGRLFHYELNLTSEDRAITFDHLLGKPMGLTLELHDGGKRYFHGIACSCRQLTGHGQFAGYHVSLRPWFWLLTRTSDCRIFQNNTVPDIIKQVFRDLGFSDFEDSLSGSYRQWEYCVQYRETSFDFVSRLMEQEGIYYYFRHEQARHVLVLADAYGAHSTVADYDSVPFYPPDRQMRERDHFYDWQLTREVQPGSLELNDYDFQRPRANLEVRSSVSRSHSNGDYPLYDYPGEYAQSNDGEHYARTRIEAIHSQFERVQLRGRARGLGSGHLFSLTGYEREDQNREYLVVSARYHIHQEPYESGTQDLSEQFVGELACMDASQVFHPLPLTPMPIVRGPQTAVVVGPNGEEIWTDQYGRVKVHFYWDRHDQSNENSSCWMRVSQAWAGKNWGAMQIPRIGQEVIVSFLEGDPDRPIITGRVYNAEQTVPYTLPANATQSGVKSRSSKGGSPANFNEIRMEDKKGAEQLFIHAEKNQDIEVENDETHWVGHDRSKSIDNDETVHVKHDRTETVDNNETITIGVNRTERVGSNETINIGSNRTISVGANETATVTLQRTHAVGINETIAIGAAQEVVIGAFQTVNVGAYQNVNVGLYQSTNVGANRSVDVGANLSTTVKANESRKVGAGRTTDIDNNDALTVGKDLVIDAGDSVTITTGKASIVMKKDGTISIRGKDITIDGSGAINIKANKNVVIKGRKILQN
ncbi:MULTISPECIES: type VI secretion system Vgr family protein [Pseudomonas]|jgi:type VI secretion system secreted protein VgrG|uniref:type VI secretion system Vgr family protein n=2 Tax=Pseudomonas TaxID=286 RepID=UPI000367B6E1|nr:MULTISPECIES: type VI secretion system Vgr family protein [Pseudomonas]PMY88228.1 type VI secretion system tip protein VgrG [Pseudomonas sp. FW303-C2]PMY91603.1 type VI secretion system tip protein VgrG [Pseudomonas sp. FW305-62]PNA40890.1 type VI secretion system tip protein VgrG [Pseudomonas sp. FW306-2-2C-A10BC]PNA87593.1 type VI secretion system tip protein VgrG [Pseudomonas sp. MPR-R3B]PNB22263.1 type VI secretion system tip protein VgrG [Pseudomonas sp. FW305-67]